MRNEKHDKTRLAADVFKDSVKFNTQLATRGLALLYALEKAASQITSPIVPGAVGGMVLGAMGFFTNRHFRQQGDVSTVSLIGELLGKVQFTAGFLLIMVEGINTFNETDNITPLRNLLKMSSTVLSLTGSAIVLINSYLYGESPKSSSDIPANIFESEQNKIS
ncbi:MAG: hypothetical protein Q8M40_02430 [Legionella sp.]|nr:hypothetical protein [Legionella sp.]